MEASWVVGEWIVVWGGFRIEALLSRFWAVSTRDG